MKMQLYWAVVALVAMASAAFGQEPPSFNAFSMWQGQGQVVEIGEHRVAIVGAFGGPVFAETTEGPTEAGRVTCPVLLTVDLQTGRQAGTGSCVFEANDGARAFGSFDCTGVHLVGCQGIFNVSGGTGRLAGVTGTSSIVFRGRTEKWTAQTGVISTQALGITIWRNIKITAAANPAPAKP